MFVSVHYVRNQVMSGVELLGIYAAYPTSWHKELLYTQPLLCNFHQFYIIYVYLFDCTDRNCIILHANK